MNSIQKTLLIIAAWAAAIGLLMSGLSGRYQWLNLSNTGDPRRFDTWTGNVEQKLMGVKWKTFVVGDALYKAEKPRINVE